MASHPALHPLTHDHHHGLKHARRLMMAARSDPAERLNQAREFLQFFASEAVPHFREEEEVLFPEVIRRLGSVPAFLGQPLMDHARIHALVGKLRDEVDLANVTTETARDLAATLERHIRMEERALFPRLERILGEEGLAQLGLAKRQRQPVAM